MKKLKIFLSVILCLCLTTFAGCKETKAEEPTTRTVGFIVFHNTTQNENYTLVKTDTTKISEFVSVEDGLITSNNNFLLFYYSTDASFESETIRTNTTTKNKYVSNGELSVTFEIIYEATDTLVFAVYKDADGNYSFDFVQEVSNLSGTLPQIVTFNTENNSLVSNISATLDKDISKQEEYQRD